MCCLETINRKKLSMKSIKESNISLSLEFFIFSVQLNTIANPRLYNKVDNSKCAQI